MGGRGGGGGGGGRPGKGQSKDQALQRLYMLENNPPTAGKYAIKNVGGNRWSVVSK